MKYDDSFNLENEELILVKTKNSNKNRLGFSVLLKYFQRNGHYPKGPQSIDLVLIKSLANQLNISPLAIKNFDWEGRSIERFRREIRDLTGFRKASIKDIQEFLECLISNIFPLAPKRSTYIEHAY